MHPPRRPVAPVLVVLVATLVVALAGCGDGAPAPAAPEPTSAAGDRAAETPDETPLGTPGSTPDGSSAYPTYVALGDSYTAAPFVPETEPGSACLRSDGNYPHLLADELRAQLVDVSCSGATTESLTNGQPSGSKVLPAQLAALDDDTALVTVGIGGNDLALFSTLIAVCAQAASADPVRSPCRDEMNAGGADLLLDKVDQIGTRVADSLAAIKERAPRARVVLVGYPQPVPARGTCEEILPLAQGDYPYVRSVIAALGTAMKRAAAKARATYVDLLGPSEGHDICAGPDAWVNGIVTDPDRGLAFHPFPEEQQAVADLVQAELEKLG